MGAKTVFSAYHVPRGIIKALGLSPWEIIVLGIDVLRKKEKFIASNQNPLDR